jgi:hypothetical protein
VSRGLKRLGSTSGVARLRRLPVQKKCSGMIVHPFIDLDSRIGQPLPSGGLRSSVPPTSKTLAGACTPATLSR